MSKYTRTIETPQASTAAPLQLTTPQRWEYYLTAEHFQYATLTDELNLLGKIGWELVAVIGRYAAILKRPLP